MDTAKRTTVVVRISLDADEVKIMKSEAADCGLAWREFVQSTAVEGVRAVLSVHCEPEHLHKY